MQFDDAKLNLKVYNTLNHVPKSYFEDMFSTESVELLRLQLYLQIDNFLQI